MNAPLPVLTERHLLVPFRLSVLMFLQWAVPGTVVPLYSYRLEQLGFSPLTIALCCASQPCASILTSLLTGQIADRWISAERAMALCALFASIDLWVLPGLQHPVAVFFATLLFWMVTGPMLLLGTTICFTHLREPDRQFGPVRLWGTVGWMVIGWFIGYWLSQPPLLHSLLGGLLPTTSGTRVTDAFLVGSGVSFALAVYSLTLPATPPRPSADPTRWFAPGQALALLRHQAFAIYCVCLLGSCMTFPFSTQNTPLLLAHLGLPPERLSVILTLAQTTEVLSLAMLPALVARWGLRRTMLLGLIAWVGANTILWFGHPVELAIASLALNGIYVTCFLIAGQVFVNTQARDDTRASAQGLSTCISGLGMLTGNLLTGGLRHWHDGELAPTFGVAAAITAAMLGVFFLGFREANRPTL